MSHKLKKINFNSLTEILYSKKSSLGIQNEACVLESYDKRDVRGQNLIIYNKKRIGCGFNFKLDEIEKLEKECILFNRRVVKICVYGTQ